ncbi:hypothetical protein BDR05DRAFT_970878 [Suillus weaverae]|nr:hypothetical protein BDR05DRAFT_970878 [Suillus weaverae]
MYLFFPSLPSLTHTTDSTCAPPSPYTTNSANGLRQSTQHMLPPTPNSSPPSHSNRTPEPDSDIEETPP